MRVHSTLARRGAPCPARAPLNSFALVVAATSLRIAEKELDNLKSFTADGILASKSVVYIARGGFQATVGE